MGYPMGYPMGYQWGHVGCHGHTTIRRIIYRSGDPYPQPQLSLASRRPMKIFHESTQRVEREYYIGKSVIVGPQTQENQ